MTISSPISTDSIYLDVSNDQQQSLELIDDLEGVSTQLSVDRHPDPTRCSGEAFPFPVDVAYKLPPITLWTGEIHPVVVRDADHSVAAELKGQDTTHLPAGQYSIDIMSMELKIYLVIDGPVTIGTDADRGRVIDGSAAERVQLGLRSFHKTPSETVTTTDSPRDVMRALSCLGSSLQTTTCERSYPTLREHPPLFELGEQFQAPPGIERTEATASVRIEVAPTFESIYPIAPLAYYLNAVVRPGEDSRIIAADTAYPIDRGDGLDAGAARLLKHVFTLDCITRTEGIYPFTLGEREELQQRLADAGIEIDFSALYEQSLARRLVGYDSIPFELVRDLVPRWPLTADVRPVAKHLPFVPFVVESLGTVRCLPTSCPRPTGSVEPVIDDFCRRETTKTEFTRSGSLVTRTDRSRSTDDTAGVPTDIYGPPKSDSITQLWLADGYPLQGTKPTLESLTRRFDALPADGYDVAVVNNDTAMRAESDVTELYGHGNQIAFEVTMYEDLARAGLRAVFAENYDLVHYVGHVDAEGLQCTDGWLDAHSIETVNVRMFLLNGCRSYLQGKALVDAGASAGMCTLTNVANTSATRIGRTVARLINAGFTLGGVLELVNENSLTGQQYMIVGDPTTAVVKTQANYPRFMDLTPRLDADTFSVASHGYAASQSRLGSLYLPSIVDSEVYYIGGSPIANFTVSKPNAMEFLQKNRFPIRINGSLLWSNLDSYLFN